MQDLVAAHVGAMIYLSVAIFQVAVILGAPLGEFTQGGRARGSLPTSGRIVAMVSLVLLMLMAGTILAMVGVGPLKEVDSPLIDGLWLGTCAYATLGVILNAVSRSPKERKVFLPVALAILCCVAVVALS
ncbi:MAG: hypothetical protein ACKOQO_00325 [Candidatus Limnocylindrus sp.]